MHLCLKKIKLEDTEPHTDYLIEIHNNNGKNYFEVSHHNYGAWYNGFAYDDVVNVYSLKDATNHCRAADYTDWNPEWNRKRVRTRTSNRTVYTPLWDE